MLFKWLPWKYMVRRVAKAHGFLDPVFLMSRLQNFAQPSEVGEPMELLRAGLVFHARGLINTRAIQNNLDWIWPYWVERQFNPRDPSFIPRAFSVSHVNLSHRNWTAVGLPDCPYLPLVDPAGLVTPFYDGSSLDAWILCEDGRRLLPSKSREPAQSLEASGDSLAVRTEAVQGPLSLVSRVEVKIGSHGGMVVPYCEVEYLASAPGPAWLAVSLRPYNPEGVSFISEIALSEEGRYWTVNGHPGVFFEQPVERHALSTYHEGDVYHKLPSPPAGPGRARCRVELATGAALFAIEPGKERRVGLKVFLEEDRETRRQFPGPYAAAPWAPALAGLAEARVPDPGFQGLYRTALRTLLLHSPGDVFPGPYTYKRFWFRDAAFILHAMLLAGMRDRVRRALDAFAPRQTMAGYFLSQEGEWDSNGEALWILRRYCEVTGEAPPPGWAPMVWKGARWILRKRLRRAPGTPEYGLLPAGFSAEHLGPNDFYYWDDFWGVAGLRSAAWMLQAAGARRKARRLEREAQGFLDDISASVARAQARLGLGEAVPASPFRRMDSGAIGSLASSYPLALWPERDPRTMASLDYLLGHCLVDGAFFQDMIHSGLNAYLSLHLAQALLRAGDPRFFQLAVRVAALASPTGQWPEAIHPRTGGGCMGDGQHVWAAAEWVLLLRNMFLREEGGKLILASGIPPAWRHGGEEMAFGPAPTDFGTVTVRLRAKAGGGARVEWDAAWRGHPPAVEIRLPGREAVIADPAAGAVEVG